MNDRIEERILRRQELYRAVWSYRKSYICTLGGYTPGSRYWDIESDHHFAIGFGFFLMNQGPDFFQSTDPIVDENGEECLLDRPEAIPPAVAAYVEYIQGIMGELQHRLLTELHDIPDCHWLKKMILQLSSAPIDCPGCALTIDLSVCTILYSVVYMYQHKVDADIVLPLLSQVMDAISEYCESNSLPHSMCNLHAQIHGLYRLLIESQRKPNFSDFL